MALRVRAAKSGARILLWTGPRLRDALHHKATALARQVDRLQRARRHVAHREPLRDVAFLRLEQPARPAVRVQLHFEQLQLLFTEHCQWQWLRICLLGLSCGGSARQVK